MGKELKLYVWDNYSPDYGPGLAFALAEDVNEATKLLTDIDGFLGDCGPVVEYSIDKIAFSRCGSM